MEQLVRQDILKFAEGAESAGEAMQMLSEAGIVPTNEHLEVLN